MMKQKPVKEYKILPQVENDRFFTNSDSRRKLDDDDDSDSSQASIAFKTKPCCVSSLILITILFIFAGTSAIIISFWWSAEFHVAVDKYWPNHPDFITPSGAHGNNSINGNGTTDYPTEGSNETYSGETTYSGEYGSTEDLNNTNSGEIEMSTMAINFTDEINEKNVGAKFAEAMRKFEKEMEKFSGIHQAELVIPLFMLVTLMSTLAFISLCCCLMSKRREKRQRKLLGKFITDLQTGDSKTILLGNDNDF